MPKFDFSFFSFFSLLYGPNFAGQKSENRHKPWPGAWLVHSWPVRPPNFGPGGTHSFLLGTKLWPSPPPPFPLLFGGIRCFFVSPGHGSPEIGQICPQILATFFSSPPLVVKELVQLKIFHKNDFYQTFRFRFFENLVFKWIAKYVIFGPKNCFSANAIFPLTRDPISQD